MPPDPNFGNWADTVLGDYPNIPDGLRTDVGRGLEIAFNIGRRNQWEREHPPGPPLWFVGVLLASIIGTMTLATGVGGVINGRGYNPLITWGLIICVPSTFFLFRGFRRGSKT